jgi:hypothetical protein
MHVVRIETPLSVVHGEIGESHDWGGSLAIGEDAHYKIINKCFVRLAVKARPVYNARKQMHCESVFIVNSSFLQFVWIGIGQYINGGVR